MKKTISLTLLIALGMGLFYNGCKHDPTEIVVPGVPCDTSNVTYAGDVYPILAENCFACHSGATPQAGLDFTDYNTVAFVAENGILLGAIKHLDGFIPMPYQLPMLDSCLIHKIEIWVRDTTFNSPPVSSHPCNPDTVYFEIDILPILNSSCAKSPHAGMNCHDVSAEKDVRLDSYLAALASNVIKPYNPGGSKMYEKITETDPEDMMPPPGETPLTAAQKELIRKWIEQGAQNLFCDEMCDSSNVTFSGTIWTQIIQKNCYGCHNGANASGGVHLENHSQIAAAAAVPVGQPGSLWGAVTHSAGNTPMPRNQPQLTDCKISQIKKWIDAGRPDN